MKAPSHNKIEICALASLRGPGRAPRGSDGQAEGEPRPALASPRGTSRWESFLGWEPLLGVGGGGWKARSGAARPRRNSR